LVHPARYSVRSAPMAPPGSHRHTPEATVTRLPVYQRILHELIKAGTSTVSSEQLADLAHVNASKVRKDLSFLGSFGTRGSGYDTAFLAGQIDRELGLGGDWPVVVVGLGNLGRALANSPGFTSRGFRVAGLFDVDPDLIGTIVRSVEVRHVDDLTASTTGDPPAIGVITAPAAVAQDVADRLVEAGAGSILNFAPRVLRVPPTVLLRYVDLSMELQVMSFFLSHRDSDPASVAGAALMQTVGVTRVEHG
jgi:redox-sensing transcriptional repressor